MKYYGLSYSAGEDIVHTIDYFIAMLEDGDSLIIEEQKRDYGSGFMWCKHYGEFIERGCSDCGKQCDYYDPCNGISGRCRQLVNTCTGTGKLVQITCANEEIQITHVKAPKEAVK